MLRWGRDYVDIGEQANKQRFRQQRVAGMKRAAESLGHQLVPQTQPSTQLPTPGSPGFPRVATAVSQVRQL